MVTSRPENAERIVQSYELKEIPAMQTGIKEGDTLKLGEVVAVDKLRQVHESWLPGYMEGEV